MGGYITYKRLNSLTKKCYGIYRLKCPVGTMKFISREGYQNTIIEFEINNLEILVEELITNKVT